MRIDEIVMKLIGDIEPVGDSGIDEKRLENLTDLCALTDNLLERIASLRRHSSRHEASIKKIGNQAMKFFISIRTFND